MQVNVHYYVKLIENYVKSNVKHIEVNSLMTLLKVATVNYNLSDDLTVKEFIKIFKKLGLNLSYWETITIFSAIQR